MHTLLPPLPDADGPGAAMHGPTLAHTMAVKRWTRDFLKLDAAAVISVSELACADPGCPLIETVIAVFEAGRTRRWKLHRPKAAVTKIMIQQALAVPPRS